MRLLGAERTEMKRMRLLLLVPMMAFELTLIGLAWVVASIRPRTAKAITDWAVNMLPGPEWYFGR